MHRHFGPLGLPVKDIPAFTPGQVEQNLWGKVRRELVADSLKVFPMHGYGALETGVHRFYEPKMSKEPTGEAQFIHRWQSENGARKITRVISYDHRALKNQPQRNEHRRRPGLSGWANCREGKPAQTPHRAMEVDTA